MKAGVLKGIDDLAVEEIPDPQLEKGSIILEVKVCSICASDLNIYRRGHPRVNLPQILGHEMAGKVVALARDVLDFKLGDRVAVSPRIFCGECFYCRKKEYTRCVRGRTFGYELPGGFAEFLLAPLHGVQYTVLNKIPDNVSFEEASLAEPLSCCLRAQRTSRVSPGDAVIVIGGGPLGVMHCRLAAIGGAGKVVLVQRDPRRLQRVDLAFVDEVVDSSICDPVPRIMEVTQGRGADVVLVACASLEAQAMSFKMAAKGARINFFAGLPEGQSNLTLNSNLIHYREILVQGTHGSNPQDCKDVLDMLARNTLKVGDLLSHTFSLDSIREAFLFAESKKGMHVAICP